MKDTIRLSGIVDESIVDGDGIRFSIFTQGCEHNCLGCHNPQTHSLNGGKDYLISDIINQIKQNPLLSGVTLSGGEPFLQAENLIQIVKQVKKLGLNIWAYSGFTYEQLESNVVPFAKELLCLVDVLIDGKYIQSKRYLTLKFKGSKNQRIIDCNKTRSLNKITLYYDD